LLVGHVGVGDATVFFGANLELKAEGLDLLVCSL
jgi:hypothetical protein